MPENLWDSIFNYRLSFFRQIHNESETTLRDIETRLNSSYNIAMTSYHSIVETYQNASRLYEEVKEAEGMILRLSEL
jgi:poly(3-hydroxyalkanoate) synthetase